MKPWLVVQIKILKQKLIQVFTFEKDLKIGYLLSVLEQTMCGIEFHSNIMELVSAKC